MAAILAAIFGVLLAGQSAASPVAMAASKTAKAGGAHVSFALAIRSPKLASGTTIRVHGVGSVDKTGADLTINLASAASDFHSMQVPSTLRAILVEKDGHPLAFVHATPMPSLAGGKDWIEADLSALAAAHGIDLGALAAATSGVMPAQALSLLRSAGATVTSLGLARVDGTQTTHYRIRLSPSVIAKATGLGSGPVGKHGSHATKTVPVNVWIGRADGLVRRVELSLKHGPRVASFSVSFTDYGTQVSISPPRSSDVFDATGLLTAFGGVNH
jgi:hypothetical protein